MKREALVVGINKYAHHPHLDSPARDAEKIAQLLEQPKGDLSWSVRCLPEIYPNGQPRVSDNQPVYQDTLSEAITNLLYPKTQQPPEIVLLFFAGHGFRQGQGEQTEGFLAATNTKPGTEDEKRSGISLSWLRSQLINSPVKKQIVWLDCCHSGELLNFTPAEIEQWQLGGDRCLIAACRDDKAAYGIDKHGVLTAVLLQALDPKLHPERQWINTGTVTDFIEQQLETDPLLKRQIPLCRNFGERIRLWQGTKQIETFPNTSQTVNTDINVLVQQVRDRLHDKIQNLHGTMQLLDVAHPVEIDRLYVDVNILTEPTSYTRLEIDDLLQGRDYRKDFDRFGLSEKRERVAGLQAVINYPKLMVLGKPGAGKTTFLQHIVIECNNGNLLTDKVPILIKLRDFVRKAKRTRNFSLEFHISDYLRGCTQSEITALLEAGKVLLLLDGLDEVPGANGDTVVDEIENFIESYSQNQLIITCRIQAQKYRFERFTSVEVADFNSEQIAAFVQKWFLSSAGNREQNGDAKAEQLLGNLKLPENKQIGELAVTPILLSLICLVFDNKGKFYSKRYELYEQGLEILLSKWDESKGVQRDNLYGNLKVEQKQLLLSYLAVCKFEQEQYVLFEQKEIKGYIASNLGISSENSKTVLTSIEVQHGLLVERAQRIYSFSHLTFQEYFVAKYIIDTSSTQEKVFQYLEPYITELRWREVFLLTTELLDNPDHFLQLLKCKIDSSLEKDLQIQRFLSWVDRKSQSLPNVYKPAAIRAFYYALAHDSPGYGFKVKTNKMPINAVFDIDLALATVLALAEALAFNQNIINAFQGNFDNTRNLASDMGFNPGFQVALTTGGIDEDSLAKAISDCLNRACIHAANLKIQLEQPLKEFVDTLHKFDIVPDIRNSSETENKINARREWWHNQGKTWTEHLRALIIEHRDIGHVWNFNPEQKQLIQFYCDASILLVNCLNSGCKVSNWVREEIEETLLLPIAEIERIKSERLKTGKTINEQ